MGVTVHFKNGKVVTYNEANCMKADGEWCVLYDEKSLWMAVIPAHAVERVDGVRPCKVAWTNERKPGVKRRPVRVVQGTWGASFLKKVRRLARQVRS